MFYMVFDNGKTNRNYSATIPERPTIPIATDNVSYIHVPGADEQLTKKDGFNNRVLSVSFHFHHTTNLMTVLRPFITQLRSTKSFYFSDDPSIEYRVKTVTFGDMEREVRVLGRCVVEFTIDPFCYYRNVARIDAKSIATFANIGNYLSRPYIKLTCDGTVTNQRVVINNLVMIFSTITGYIEMDCKTRRVYKDSVTNNLGHIVTADDFPVLITGTNNVSCTSGITHVYIDPRWRCF